MKPTTDAHGRPKAEMTPRMVDRDIDLKAVAITVFGIAGLTVLAALTMWWLLSWFLVGAEAADPPQSPAVAATPRELPGGPRLQALPRQHWDRMRAREELILSSYGVSAEGRLRIPVERAIEALVAQSGDPAAAGVDPADEHVVAPVSPAAGDPEAGNLQGDPGRPPTAPVEEGGA